jgi:UDP-2,3-diacylglucosamine pyrophosphatase LpxH
MEFLAKRLDIPIYFVLGNHDSWLSSFGAVGNRLKKMCGQYPHLHWLDQEAPLSINDETGIIGCTGWYDGRNGQRDYIKFTFDWFMIKELRGLAWTKRFEMFRQMADEDTSTIIKKLEQALDEYKSVILLTHFPAWREASRYSHFLDETFWSAYNVNVGLGKALEKVMEKHKKRHLTVLCGHTHTPAVIEVSRNITCRVGKGSYSHLSDEETIYI